MIEWRIAPGFPDYEVSDTGVVRRRTPAKNTFPGRVATGRLSRKGYLVVKLVDRAGRYRNQYVHLLVCRAFHGDRPSAKHESRHVDGNKLRNIPGNLAWGLPKENALDRIAHGTQARGSRQGCAKLAEAQIPTIRRRIADGDPVCVIARDFGVAHGTIGAIKSGRTWTHVHQEERAR